MLLGLLYVAALAAIRLHAPFTDEVDHFAQVTQFLHDTGRVLPGLTTIPGYHALVAAILRACGADSLDAARLVNGAFGLFAVAGFHAVRRRAWPGTETLATAQLIVLPILVPLFFVVYTDVLALALLLWATWASLARRHLLAALLACALVGVRQHEVVWGGLLFFLAAGDRAVDDVRDGGLRFLRPLWPYVLPFGLFLGFWIWNGSISLSRTETAVHPDVSLHAANPLFALLVAGLLMPLQALHGLHVFARAPRDWRWLLLVPVLACAFWFAFRVDNPLNTNYPWFYLHNHLALYVDQHPFARALASCVVGAACGFAAFRLSPRAAYAMVPIAFVFLAASWLVELRYAMVPIVLWLAFREQRSRPIEYATLALWLVLAVCIYVGTLANRFFL